MKTVKKMLVSVVSLTMLLCGCDKTSGEDTPETNRLFSVTAEIRYGENDVSCKMTRLGDNLWKSEISSPFEIEGVALSLSDDIMITEYHGMTVAADKNTLPEDNVHLIIAECIDHSAKAPSLPYYETDDGKRIFSGECEKGEYKLTVDESGNLCSLSVDSKGVTAEFSDFCVIE